MPRFNLHSQQDRDGHRFEAYDCHPEVHDLVGELAAAVRELDELQCCDGDAEVRFLAQPSWPFEYTIAGVVEASDRPDDLSGYHETPAGRVLLVEGRQACYGDRRAFESVGSEW